MNHIFGPVFALCIPANAASIENALALLAGASSSGGSEGRSGGGPEVRRECRTGQLKALNSNRGQPTAISPFVKAAFR
jgi:hypothetical protein